MKVAIQAVTPFQQNCSLVWCEKTRKGAFIDPGGDLDRLQACAKEYEVDIEKILVTHAHIVADVATDALTCHSADECTH